MENLPFKPRYLNQFIIDLALCYQKMAFISGPRQVGKTTCAKSIAQTQSAEFIYKNWDDKNFRRDWTKDPASSVSTSKDKELFVIFDEIHKAKLWKRDLKGVFDLHSQNMQILVTGSARLNIFKKGGDSLLGRYIPFRLHPFSMGELCHKNPTEDVSVVIDQIFNRNKHSLGDRGVYERLFTFGGFPSPYSRASNQYLNIWHHERVEKLIREDLRDLSRIPDLSQIEMLASILPERVGNLLSVASLRRDLECAHNTVKNWLQYLEQLFYIYTIPPYSKGLARSLKKEPKLYLWDWSEVESVAARFENLVASTLLKSCNFWSDIGMGTYQLCFLRDKEKLEVDFLITKKQKPCLSIEAKLSSEDLNTNFIPFCKKLGLKHHIQMIHSPGIWQLKKVGDIEVVIASAELILPYFV